MGKKNETDDLAGLEFDFYEKMTGANADPNPRVTLTGSQINFNPAAVKEYLDPLAEKLKMDCVGYVQLGFCKTKKVIGLFPAVEEDRRTLCVQQKEGESARIGVSGFIKRYGIADMTYRVLAVHPQEKGLFLTFTDQTIPQKQFKKKDPPPVTLPVSEAVVPDQKAKPTVVEPDEEARRAAENLRRHKRLGRPPKVAQYECVECGHSDSNWRVLYPLTGQPEACPKCNGYTFTEI